MFTSFPLRPSSSATYNMIKLTWASESRNRFPRFFFFLFPDSWSLIPGFPVRWEELLVSWNCQSWSRVLCIRNVYQQVVEVLALIYCIGVSWKPARFKRQKQLWSSLTALTQSLGLIDVKFGHWSIQWVDILHNQHFWFTSLSRKLLVPHRHIDAWHSVSYFSVVLWPSFVTSFRMSSKTLLLPVWCDILWCPRNVTKLCGRQSTFFVQWSLTCDYYPYDFVAQLPKGCWNFIWPGVLIHKSGCYPGHVKAWIQGCLA